MKKLVTVNMIVFALCLLAGANLVNAQDTTKAKTIKPVVRTQPANTGAVKYQATKPYVAAPVQKPVTTVPATTVPGAQQVVGMPTPVSTDKSLNGQYQYVLSKTYRYQQPMIAALWKNINDSLSQTRKSLKELQTKLTAQTQSVNSLQNDVKTKDQTLSEANNKRDEVNLLGLSLTKTSYNLVMWGLVIGMALVLVIVILRTAGAGREAKYRTKLYEELNEEYLAYKVKTNDKEKKLARELQTERNKVDELMGRG
jgi:vacuolar-type H+-ATPase subunit I/STV1